MLRGDVSDRNARRHFLGAAIARHFQIGRESGAAESAEIEREESLLDGAKRVGDAAGGVQFDGVPLAVGDGQGVTAEAVGAGGGEGDGGIKTAAHQNDSWT